MYAYYQSRKSKDEIQFYRGWGFFSSEVDTMTGQYANMLGGLGPTVRDFSRRNNIHFLFNLGGHLILICFHILKANSIK
jgi:hypothetical protein